jgi:hypothetical protein
VVDSVVPLRRAKPPKPVGRTCICGATWRPGFSSNPAWLITADPKLGGFTGVLHCHCCGRLKLDVIREQAEQKRAEQPLAIPVRREERAPAAVVQLRARDCPDPNKPVRHQP